MAGLLDEAFADVVPVPQDDGPTPIVPIAYPPGYVRLMDLFRAFLKSGERSPRVLELTAAIIEHNAAHYTVWHVRRQCLWKIQETEGGAVLEDELAYSSDIAHQNPKNYQIWYHRRSLCERLGAGQALPELEFIAEALRGDAKNYHAWSHRLWVLKTYGHWEAEEAFIEGLLRDDVYNNSAWNHRYNFATREGAVVDSVGEVRFALAKLPGAEENESPWVFALAFARKDPAAKAALLEHCEAQLRTEAGAKSAWVHSALVDLLEDAGRARRLETELDATRHYFWARRAEELENAAGIDNL